MANRMKDYLPKIDMEKMEKLYQIEEQYETGQVSLDEAHRFMREQVGTLRPYHIAYMEQNLKSGDEDECVRVDMRKVLQLLDGFMDTSRPELPTDHPIAHYYQENDHLREVLKAVDDLVQYPVIKNQWLEIFDELKQYPVHYHRKQNQLYPLLEKKGFDRPTTTMWNFDDIVRDDIKESFQLLEAGDDEAFVQHVQELAARARDLMQKEETILYPTSLALISAQEFEDMKSGDQEIGFAFITVEHHAAPSAAAAPVGDGFAADLQALLSKYGYSVGAQQELDVRTGKLTLEQINLIYRHLPVDISYVDENELVRFYSDTDHRIFPRSKNVIGREVVNCHPRKSVHIVKEIVEKFRSGEQDKAEFWINKPDLFIYIIYIAVRDDQGRFRGVLEMMQDCTRIRSLVGSQTLLTWSGEDKADSAPAVSEPETTDADPSGDGSIPTASITENTKLTDLFKAYPNLKKALSEKYPPFKMLNSPLGKIVLRKATIKMASERSGLSIPELISLIKESIQK